MVCGYPHESNTIEVDPCGCWASDDKLDGMSHIASCVRNWHGYDGGGGVCFSMSSGGGHRHQLSITYHLSSVVRTFEGYSKIFE